MASRPTSPLDTALALLARREHSRQELGRKLRQKGIPNADIPALLEKLQADGYLDDSRYAMARARYRVMSSKWGWSRVAMELRSAGIDSDTLTATRVALEDDGLGLTDGAAVLAHRAMAKPAPADREARLKRRQKAIAALVRKGYSLGDAKSAVDSAESDDSESDSPTSP